MLFESCTLKGKRICNPIVDCWDSDVWEYIRSERLEINPLYDMGFYRGWLFRMPYGWEESLDRVPVIPDL